MKFKLRITKDILRKSMTCGTNYPEDVSTNCAFALAFNELVPNTSVGLYLTWFYNENSEALSYTNLTTEQISFIRQFDRLVTEPEKRLLLPEQEFDVEIPDKVINHYYGDSVKAIQHLIDNPVLTPII